MKSEAAKSSTAVRKSCVSRSVLAGPPVGVAMAWVLAIVGTLVILKVVDVVIGLRVSEDEEIQGLDLSQHGEEGYAFDVTA